jgi:transmembrane sensor
VHDPDPATLQQEAQRWLSRMTSGAATDADRTAFLRWRGQSPAHEEAFRAAARLWRQVGVAAQAMAAVPERGAAPQPSRRYILKAGLIAAGAGGIAIGGAKLGFWPDLNGLMADYRTVAGEQRRVDLSAQVRIELNTRSALSVNATAGPARVTLASGEAVFTVSPGTERLLVSAGEGTVAAERAVFALRHDNSGVRITCLDGAVEVLEPAPQRLRTLEQVVCAGKSLGPVSRLEGDEAVAGWRRGLLVFRNEPVENVVSELNRYRKGLIVVASRAAAARRVTGVFHLDRLEESLQHLEQTLSIPVRHVSPYFVVLG